MKQCLQKMDIHRIGRYGEYYMTVDLCYNGKVKILGEIHIYHPIGGVVESENRELTYSEFNEIFPSIIGYCESIISAIPPLVKHFILKRKDGTEEIMNVWDVYYIIERDYGEKGVHVLNDMVHGRPACIPVKSGMLCISEK